MTRVKLAIRGLLAATRTSLAAALWEHMSQEEIAAHIGVQTASVGRIYRRYRGSAEVVGDWEGRELERAAQAVLYLAETLPAPVALAWRIAHRRQRGEQLVDTAARSEMDLQAVKLDIGSVLDRHSWGSRVVDANEILGTHAIPLAAYAYPLYESAIRQDDVTFMRLVKEVLPRAPLDLRPLCMATLAKTHRRLR